MPISNFDESAIYGKKFFVKEAFMDNVLLEDENQNQKACLDLTSVYGATNFGHCNKEISPFEKYKVDIAPCFYPIEGEYFSNWITQKLNLVNYDVLFQIGGSMAVSTALSIAQRVKKGKVVHLVDSFHGLGPDALSITSVHKNFALQNTELTESLLSQVIELPKNKYLSDIGFDWKDVSCLIFEPIQGANGYTPLPLDWLQNTINQAKKNGVIIIADEIQSGFFRHGELSISNSLNLSPDIYLFSKSMTNGLYPFSAVVFNGEFKKVIKDKFFLAHTFQTSALGCFAATSVANFIDKHPIHKYCKDIENTLENFALKLRDFKLIKEIYVTGPTLSFEVINNKSKELVNKCLENNVLIFTGGRNGQRIRVAPTITMNKDNLKKALNILLQVIEAEELILV